MFYLRCTKLFLPNDVDILKAPKQTRPYPNRTLPLFWNLHPHTYVHNPGITKIAETSKDDTQGYNKKPTRISCVKQCKINITCLSKRNNATDSSRSRSLSSLHCWKAAPIFTWVLPIAWTKPSVLFLRYFPLFYLPILSIYGRSANIRPVHSN